MDVGFIYFALVCTKQILFIWHDYCNFVQVGCAFTVKRPFFVPAGKQLGK